MTSKVRSKLPLIFAGIGGVVGVVIGFVAHSPTGPAGDSATSTALFVHFTGLIFGCMIAGAVVGCIVSACVPAERTTCPKCGSTNAIATYKSVLDGKVRPSRCPDCKHEW